MNFYISLLLSLLAINAWSGGPPPPEAQQIINYNPSNNTVVFSWTEAKQSDFNYIETIKTLINDQKVVSKKIDLRVNGSLTFANLTPGLYSFCHYYKLVEGSVSPSSKCIDYGNVMQPRRINVNTDVFIPEVNMSLDIVEIDEAALNRDYDGKVALNTHIPKLTRMGRRPRLIDDQYQAINIDTNEITDISSTIIRKLNSEGIIETNILNSGRYIIKAKYCPNNIAGKCSISFSSKPFTVERTPPSGEIIVSNFSASTASIEIAGSAFAFNSINPRYIVLSRSKGSDSQWTNWVTNNVINIPMADVAKAETKQVELSGLANNRDYEVKVQACNSSCSETVASNLIEVRYPSTNLNIGPVSGYGSYNLTWTPSDLDKDPIYILKETRQSNGDVQLQEFTDLDGSMLVAKQKINNDVYEYQLNGCYEISGRRSCTGYSPVVKAAVSVQLDTPSLSTLSVNNTGLVALNWEAVNGVPGHSTYYRIYNDANLLLHTTVAGQLSWEYSAQDNDDYTFQVQACSYDHCSPKSAARTIAVSVTPNAPTFSKVNASSSGFEISWSQPNRADSYSLQHKLNSGNWQAVVLTQQQINERRYSVSLPSEMVAQGNHFYQIKACDSSVNKCSGFSNMVSHTVNYVPSNGVFDIDRANSQCDSLITDKCFTRIPNITVVWDKDTSGLAHYYEIFESEGAMPIHVENITQTSHLNTANITGLTTGTYFFKYRSCSNFNTTACSAFSNPIEVQISLPVPVTVPAVINAYEDIIQTDLVTGPYQVKWPSVEGADLYDVYRKLHSSEEFVKVESIGDSSAVDGVLTYTYDPALMTGDENKYMTWGEHTYYVTAYNGDNGVQNPPTESNTLVVTVELDETVALRKKLYYPEAEDIDGDKPEHGQFDRDKAAFRYLDLMYEFNSDAQIVVSDYFNGDGAVGNRDFTELYDDAERARVDEVLAQLSENLTNAYDEILANEPNATTRFTNSKQLLLDVFYDRAVAEMVLANQDLDESRISRLREEGAWTELSRIEDAHQHFYIALMNYSDLFIQSQYDYPFLIEEQVTSRKQNSPRYWQDGFAYNVVNDASSNLLSEYKDLILYFDLASKVLNSKVKAIELRVHDIATTQPQLDLMEQDIFALRSEIEAWTNALQGRLPNTVFSEIASIEFKKAMDRYTQSLDAVETVVSWVNGETNILGLGDDSLIIVNGGYGIDGSLTYNSYDAIVGLLIGDGNKKGYLTIAKEDFQEAVISYENYRHNQDQLASQYNDRNINMNNSLISLIGWSVPTGCYENCVIADPEAVSGSEISLQIRRLEQAQIDIETAATRLENLEVDIREMVRVEQIRTNINDLINETILDYGEEQASIQYKIGKIQQKLAKARKRSGLFGSAVKLITSPENAFETLANAAGDLHVANAEIRAAKDLGQLQALSTQLAAAERVQINELYSEIRDAEFASQIRSRLRDVALLELDIERTASVAEQEHERLTAMVNQTMRLMTQIQNTNTNLADRYFADPIHAVRLTRDMEKAEASFETAQRWMFYAAKALEYKWLVNFNYNNYRTEDILRARSVADLEDVLYSGMQILDNNKTISNAFEQSEHVLSFKKDIFGFYDQVNDVTQYYSHPAGDMTTDGQGNQVPVKLRADAAFIETLRLNQEILASGNWLNIDFDTFRPAATGNFFAGPEFDNNGCMVIGGTYLDKIETIGLNVSHFMFGGKPSTNAYLKYGGVSYIRNKEPGIEYMNADQESVINEFTSYPVTFWDADKNDFDESFVVATKASLIGAVDQGSTTALFKDRSVAASDWNLRLQLDSDSDNIEYLNVDFIDDIELIINHRYLNRNYLGNCP
jgi:hypothetical protein